jgi:hypothetical protein
VKLFAVSFQSAVVMEGLINTLTSPGMDHCSPKVALSFSPLSLPPMCYDICCSCQCEFGHFDESIIIMNY